jgi:hypothetical protein
MKKSFERQIPKKGWRVKKTPKTKKYVTKKAQQEARENEKHFKENQRDLLYDEPD